MISIEDHFLALSAEDLKAFLQKVGQSTKAMTRKAQFADALEEVLTRRLSEFIRALSDNERGNRQFLQRVDAVPREQLGGWLAGGCRGISKKHRIGTRRLQTLP